MFVAAKFTSFDNLLALLLLSYFWLHTIVSGILHTHINHWKYPYSFERSFVYNLQTSTKSHMIANYDDFGLLLIFCYCIQWPYNHVQCLRLHFWFMLPTGWQWFCAGCNPGWNFLQCTVGGVYGSFKITGCCGMYRPFDLS